MVAQKKCFVLMPFKEEFNNPWEFAIQPAASENHLVPFRADDRGMAGGRITKDITKSIMEADIIVAEMTGLNPNVLYELGLAHAAKKRVLMITQSSEEIPFDLKDIRHISYNINRLPALRDQLSQQIRAMLGSPGPMHDFFPELEIFGSHLRHELENLERENAELASLAHGIKVTTKPDFAYIFFNNRYMGIAPQTIRVNPHNEENIITVFALEHFEEYHAITVSDLNAKHIHFDLSKRDPDQFPKRVHRWLKYIKKQPNDIVIGKAIATYLDYIGEYEEAVKQLHELLEICDWSMLYNGIWYSLSRLGKHEEAIPYILKVKDKEKSFICHYNLACSYSMTRRYEDCLDELRAITNNQEYLKQCKETGPGGNMEGFASDPDFANIIADPIYGPQFAELNAIVANWRPTH